METVIKTQGTRRVRTESEQSEAENKLALREASGGCAGTQRAIGRVV